MISLRTNEIELDRNPDSVEESEVKAGGSDDDCSDSSNCVVDGEGFVDLSVSGETRVSRELDSGAPGIRRGDTILEGRGVGNDEPENGRSDGEARVSTSEEARVSTSEEFKGSSSVGVRVSWEAGGREIGREMESIDVEVKDEDLAPRASLDQYNAQSDPVEHMESETDGSDVTPRGSVDGFVLFDSENNRTEGLSSSSGRHAGPGSSAMSQYDSLLSKFDDYVASGGGLQGVGMRKSLQLELEPGEMVWGKVKSHPWWPGHIFNEAFASASVRRTKREGHILVAFFGDSSYGWFDPSELIPFDPNYAEKSTQTNMRNFTRAVEEALDEVERRCAIGLTCRCRSPRNFRPTKVQGHFVVDVADYEHGAIYSEGQIKKARDGFQPAHTLAFIKQLATTPRDNHQKSIDWIKNTATVSAYRKAVFEEFDETYAQAFGYPAEQRPSQRPPQRPSRMPKEVTSVAPRAPLSGPLVIAETLGGGRGSTKPAKVKDQSKKDRYLFKRRDEPNISKSFHNSEGQASSSAPSAFMEEELALSAGDFVFQKRAPPDSLKPQVLPKHEKVETPSRNGASASSQNVTGKEDATMEGFPSDQAPGFGSTFSSQGGALDKGKVIVLERKDGMGLDVAPGPVSSGGSALSAQSGDTFLQEDDRTEGSAKTVQFHEGYLQPKPTVSLMAEGYPGDQVQDGRSGVDDVAIDSKFAVMVTGGKVKAKVRKRPIGDMSSEKSVQGEKKKKRKKEMGVEASTDHQQKRSATGKIAASVRKLAGKSVQAGGTSRVDSRGDHQKKVNGAGSSLPNAVGTLPEIDLENADLELPQLLNDLQLLALDPFHGAGRNGPAVVLHVFLRFRSLVYQKSTSPTPSAENEPSDIHSNKSLLGVGVSNNTPSESVSVKKPPRPLGRPDDPTKGGRKRAPSDRQEEMAVKKMKKISDLKSMAAEKKAGLKIPEAQRVERKETVGAAPAKTSRPDSIKKPEAPAARVVEPTMLVMKFPPQTTLPSGPALRARFARFGPLDHSSTRVFWKSYTCRVVFLYKNDAQKAYKYALGNGLFGNVNVRYHLRESGGSENPEFGKIQGEDAFGETPPPPPPPQPQRDAGIERRPSLLPPLLHPPPQQQLKSCLKKSNGDEAGQAAGSGNGNGGGRAIPRVKFMLGGEDESNSSSSRIGDPLMMVGNRNNNFNNNNNNASFADGGASSSSSSVAMDFISNNYIQKVIPPSPLPILPLPSQFAMQSPQNMHFGEVALPPQPQPPPRIMHNFNNTPSITPTTTTTTISAIPPPLAPLPTTIDISQPMLNLLTRCNDVVSSVKSFLGYVPYHPL